MLRECLRWPLLALLVAAAAAGVTAQRLQRIETELGGPPSLRGADYATSSACRSCHPTQYRSWHATFHRTMTQEATATSVVADFARGDFEYGGVHASMRRDALGRPVMEFSRHGGLERWSAIVERTVGSRRYQQYLARDHDVYYRLPIAWSIEEQRFMHMNGAFLTPDPAELARDAPVERADYDRHVTRWNDNCVFCHNVAANPGLQGETGRFRTRVAELGIACEACHGPAERHAARNRDPLRRFALHLGTRADPTIANPARLSPQRSAQVCGRCHGQRIAPDIARVHRDGDAYVAGEDLAAYSEPLWRDTALHGDTRAFETRFWPDGTARLTAYEYQGLLQSACAQRGELTCTTCHGMHEGDPRGQLRPALAGDAICTQCHAELASDARKAAHARHPAASSGARCVNCHMPRVVYGLVGAHRSHRIDSPRPLLQPQHSRPDACTLCHTDRSRAWAERGSSGALPGAALAGARAGISELPEATRLLLAGDPIERALAADALGRAEAHAAGAPTAPRLGLLADAALHDAYPAVRAIAWRSMRALLRAHHPDALPPVSAFTATDGPAERARSVEAVLARLPPSAVRAPDAATTALRALAPAVQIAIGE